jgi:hypothetical protein
VSGCRIYKLSHFIHETQAYPQKLWITLLQKQGIHPKNLIAQSFGSVWLKVGRVRDTPNKVGAPNSSASLKIFHIQQYDFNFLGDFFLSMDLKFPAQFYRFIVEMQHRAIQMLQAQVIFRHQRRVTELMHDGE